MIMKVEDGEYGVSEPAPCFSVRLRNVRTDIACMLPGKIELPLSLVALTRSDTTNQICRSNEELLSGCSECSAAG